MANDRARRLPGVRVAGAARHFPRRGLPALLWLLIPVTAPAQQPAPAPDPLTAAFEAFAARPPELQHAILADIRARLEADEREDVQDLMSKVREAREGLPLRPGEPVSFLDPRKYARGLVQREFLAPESPEAQRIRDRFPAFVRPPCHAAIRYSYGLDVGLLDASARLPSRDLENLMYGYPPDADHLTAWVEGQFDHDRKLDPIALHFEHAYCTLEARCVQDVTLYQAFCAGDERDMPDVDAIAYAQNVLKKRTFRSPIPPGKKREALYDEVTSGFFYYFQQRTFCEAVADLYLNPDAALREEHENLRNKILYWFVIDGMDFSRMRRRLLTAGDRDGLIDKLDALIEADRLWEKKVKDWVQRRNEVRWAVVEMAHRVLREYYLLQD